MPYGTPRKCQHTTSVCITIPQSVYDMQYKITHLSVCSHGCLKCQDHRFGFVNCYGSSVTCPIDGLICMPGLLYALRVQCEIANLLGTRGVYMVTLLASIQFLPQVCFFALLFRQTAKAEARKPLLECWCHG